MHSLIKHDSSKSRNAQERFNLPYKASLQTCERHHQQQNLVFITWEQFAGAVWATIAVNVENNRLSCWEKICSYTFQTCVSNMSTFWASWCLTSVRPLSALFGLKLYCRGVLMVSVESVCKLPPSSHECSNTSPPALISDSRCSRFRHAFKKTCFQQTGLTWPDFLLSLWSRSDVSLVSVAANFIEINTLYFIL